MNKWTTCLQRRISVQVTTSACLWCILILLILFGACAKRPTTEQVYAVGETATIEGWQVTVHSFSMLPADPWHQPQEGYVLCAVELTLQNSSGKIRYVMPEKQMVLLDENNCAYTLDSRAGVMAARLHKWFVPQGGLDPGQQVRGAAAYQIPTSAQNLRWTFRAGLMPWSSKAIFALGAPQQ